MIQIAPTYFAGMRGPLGYWYQAYPPVLDADGTRVVDFTQSKTLAVQAVRPDGQLGPLWTAGDANPQLNITFHNVTQESFEARHTFRSDVDELPWLANLPPSYTYEDESQLWQFRHTLTVGGVAVQMSATCFYLRNRNVCPC